MKLLRKSFVISMEFDGSFLDIVEIILEKINTGRVNSAILFGALEFIQTIISQFVIFFIINGLATLTTFKWRSWLPTFCYSAMILVALQNNRLTMSYATIQIKVGNPYKINKTLPQKFRGIHAKTFAKKKNLALVLDSDEL